MGEIKKGIPRKFGNSFYHKHNCKATLEKLMQQFQEEGKNLGKKVEEKFWRVVNCQMDDFKYAVLKGAEAVREEQLYLRKKEELKVPQRRIEALKAQITALNKQIRDIRYANTKQIAAARKVYEAEFDALKAARKQQLYLSKIKGLDQQIEALKTQITALKKQVRGIRDANTKQVAAARKVCEAEFDANLKAACDA